MIFKEERERGTANVGGIPDGHESELVNRLKKSHTFIVWQGRAIYCVSIQHINTSFS
nr:MAG TPA: hypothetical protein [Caudoviricetes sp.]